MKAFWTVFLVLSTAIAHAEEIKFPDEELATESVLPVFDQPVSVKNRSVTTAGRFELGGFGSYALTEPFFNPMSIGGTATYHFTEVHGINIVGNFFLGGASGYSGQLNPIPQTSINANLQNAPAPKFFVLGNYQHTAFYGKMSVSKNFVMNLSLYGLLGAGMIAIGDSSRPVVSAGLGQKFYFSPNFGLRFDLQVLAYRGPDPVSTDLSKTTTVQPTSVFTDKTYISPILSIGAVFILPSS